MNKTVSIIFIVLLSIITIALISLLVVLLSGNYNFGSFSFYIGNNYSTNLLESKEYESCDAIKIDSSVGDIFIEESSNERIIVELYSDHEVDSSILNEDNIIKVTFKDKNNTINFLQKQNKVLVKIPSYFDKKMTIYSTTGDIHGDSFPYLDFDIQLKTGDIKITEAKEIIIDHNVGDIKIDRVSLLSGKLNTGDIKINTIDSINITATTGDIKIENINEKIKINHTIGDIKIQNAIITSNSSIKNKTGDIKINKLSGAYIDASTTVGDVKVKNNDRKLDLEIKITNNVGDISINN